MGNQEFREFPDMELPEISKSLLREVLTSQEFHNKFEETIGLYNEKHREFGFALLKNPSTEQIWYGDVVGGEGDNEVSLTQSLKTLKTKLKKEGVQFHPFLDLHIHPYHFGEVIIPTVKNGDLQDANKDRTYATERFREFITPSITLIATPNPNNINILAIREPLSHNPFELEESINQLEERLFDDEPIEQEEVVRLLHQLGYSAEILTADLSGNFDETSIEKFAKFSFQPVEVAPESFDDLFD